VPRTPGPVRLAELAARLDVPFDGDGTFEIHGFASLFRAKADELVFLRDAAHLEALQASEARAVIAPPGVDVEGRAVLRSPHPARDFSRAVDAFAPRPRPAEGIDPRALVDPTAVVEASASVGPGAVVGPGCRVGARSVVAANATLVADVVVGDDCWVHAGAVLESETRVGHRVVLHAGVVLGADGFGYLMDEAGRPVAMAQRGRVVVEDDVEIGANTTVDRATLDETRIRRGAKIDNLVQIAHNCDIGEDVLIASQTGLSGGTVVGRGAILMGQVGAIGHLRIGERAFVAARSGLQRDVPDGARVYGAPATEEHGWHRQVAALRRLPELLRRVRRLERARARDAGDDPRSERDSETS
jgi:UDP-3-O-[3-hydroxymyristoyl] glucosamine N-acyltransferase